MYESMTQLHRIPLEVRAADDAPEGVVEAYGSVFDTEYVVGYGERERIARGAFKQTLKDRDSIAIFYQHGHRYGFPPIGFTERAWEDKKGLRFRAKLLVDESETARAVFRAIEAGALKEWSIGFRPVEVRNEDDDVTEIVEADLPEISAVLIGANPDTDTVDAREATDVVTVRLTADAEELRAACERIQERLADLEDDDTEERDDPEPEPEPVEGWEELMARRDFREVFDV